MSRIERLIVATACLVAATAASAQQYRVTDLGTLGGSNPPRPAFSTGTGINASGQVAGYSFGLSPPDMQFHAFISDATTHALTDLGELQAHGTAEALGVNASGQVTGNSLAAKFNSPIHAFVSDPITHALIDLGTLGCGLKDYCNGSSYGTAINDKGQVTGYSSTADSVYPSQAFITDPVTRVMSPILLTCACSSAGYGINASGQVTGSAAGGTSGSRDGQAFILDTNTSAVTWLGTLGGTSSSGYGINAVGQVTGVAALAGGSSHAFLYGNGVMQDLGTLGGATSQGNAVNAGGVVTGVSATSSGDTHGFVYADGVMTDLNALIGDASGLYTLTAGQGINDSGQIVANGVEIATGLKVAFLLTPTAAAPVPTVSVTVSPGTVYEGQNASVVWTSTGATACTSSGAWAGAAVGLNGSTPVAFTKEGAYSFFLTCTGAGGSAVASASLTVTSGITLKLAANDLPAGGAASLTWSAFPKATSCSASGAWSGDVPLSGSRSVGPLPTGDYSFQLTCSGAGLTTTATRSVTVYTPEDFSYVGLMPTDNIYAVTAPGTTAAAGGLDSHGYAYSSQTLPYPLTAFGQTFEVGAASQPTAISKQVIALSGQQLANLTILATGVNGNQLNQSFVVSYADGTTDVFVQSLSDWHHPQNYPGETIAAAPGYRVTPTGTTEAGIFDLYAYRFPIDLNKRPVSLKLPANRNVVVLAINESLPSYNYTAYLPGTFNVYGLVSMGHAAAGGGVDGHGYAYEADLLTTPGTGSPFYIAYPDQLNALSGTTITLHSSYTQSLTLVAAGMNGNQLNQNFLVTYADGSTTSFVQNVSDWHRPQNYPGESIVATSGYRVTPTGERQAGEWDLYTYTFQPDPNKVIVSLTLPRNRNVVVFSVNTRAH